jgi:hypothetical protein
LKIRKLKIMSGMSLSRFLQYAFIAIVVTTVGFSLYQWNASRAALKMNTNLNLNTSGLVGHWTLDGTDTIWTSSTAGTTLDKSGNGNTGTLTNMNRATTPASGKLGQGMNLGGDVVNGKYVDLGSATSLDNIETQTGNGMTVSAWINPRSGGGYNVGTIVGKATDPDVGSGHWSFGMSNSGNIKFEKGYSTTLFSVSSRASSIELNKWQHVLVTWDGSENASNTHIYINGIESNYLVRNNGVGTKGSDAGASLLVGGPNRFFDGAIDDVRVYNRALSASEISDLYQMGGVKENTSALQPQGIGNLNSGLTGYWKFDDGSGSTAADSSGNANTGTLVNTPTWTTGQIGGGIGLVNASAQYVSLGNPSTYDLTSTGRLTVSAWVKTGSSIINSTLGIVKRGATNTVGAPDQYALTSSNTRWRFMAGNGTTYTEVFGPGAQLVPDTWYHLTGVIDAANISLYVNGVSAATPVARPAGSPPASVSNFIGSVMAGGPAWDGTIDEVRIYSRALSAEEISRLYRLTTPTGVDTSLKGYWSLDGHATNWTSGTTGTTADLSSYNNTGTLTNMNRATSPVIGNLGQGVLLDGTDDYVAFPASTNTAFNTASRSASIWMKTTGAAGGDRYAFSAGNGSPNRYYIGTNGLGLQSTVGDGSDMSSSVLNANEWYHVVVTYEAGVAKTYLNGVLDSQVSVTLSGVGEVNIGSYMDGSGNFFSGSVDDVRIYDRSLSLSEITDLYQTGVKKINTTQNINTNGLVGHWSFDGKDTIWSSSSAGTTLDTSGNSNTGTLTSMSRATSPSIGKLGQAFSFGGGGSGDYVNFGSATNLDDIETQGGGGMTATAWINPRSSGGASNSVIIGKSNSGTAGYWRLYNTGRLTFGKDFSTTDLQTMSNASNPLTYNQWQHVAVTWDGSALYSNVHLYINGAEISGYTSQFDGVGGKVSDAANNMLVSASGTNEFDGGIDDVRVYNRILSAAEIAFLYNSGR